MCNGKNDLNIELNVVCMWVLSKNEESSVQKEQEDSIEKSFNS